MLDSILKVDEYFLAALVYALINICVFLKLNSQETLYAVKKFLFSSWKKSIKIEEATFFDKKTNTE